MSKVYVPKVNPAEKHLHIRTLMHMKLASMVKSGKLKLGAPPVKGKFPKIGTFKKFKKG